MNHLHLVASSRPPSSRAAASHPASAGRTPLYLVPDTGSLRLPRAVTFAAPKGPGLVAAVVRVAILASAGIAFVTSGIMPAPGPATEPAGTAVPAGPKQPAGPLMAAIYGRKEVPTAREDPRWKEM